MNHPCALREFTTRAFVDEADAIVGELGDGLAVIFNGFTLQLLLPNLLFEHTKGIGREKDYPAQAAHTYACES